MRFLCLGLALFLAPLSAWAEFVTLIPVADTTISEQNTANTSPGGDTLIVGRLGNNGSGSRARGLLRFDLSSIPAHATISSVMLTVTVTKNHLETLDRLAVHRLTTDWDEFDASWDAGVTPWNGGDFIELPDATVMVQGAGPFTFVSGAALLATVRMWLTNAATNYGWILLNQNEVTLSDARRIGSREAFGGQPALTIEYSVLPPPPAPLVRILSIDLSSSNVVLKSTGTNGWLALPEFSSNLVVSNWAVVPGFINTFTNGTNVSVFNRLDPICGSNVYLRVRNTRN